MMMISSASADGPGKDHAFDLIIRGATVYDGDSLRGMRADIAVEGDRIAAVGELGLADARRVIDGGGLVVTPGFIDAHTHSDFNQIVYRDLANKISQGVTTEITGNCGMSAAPVQGDHGKRMTAAWAREGVDISGQAGWQTFDEYGRTLTSLGMTGNVAPLVGHGNIRSAVMGFDARKATDAELERMKDLVRQSMDEGAFGVSFGLIYLPGIFADADELAAVCGEAGKQGGVCAFHMMNEGSRMLESLDKTLAIGRETNAAIQISHLKLAGPANWTKAGEAVEKIRAARGEGLEVMADLYPYEASFAELGVILPEDLYESSDRVKQFQDTAKRGDLVTRLKKYYKARNRDWSLIRIATVGHPAFEKFSGKTIEEAAREAGQEPEAFLVDLLGATSFQTSAFSFSQSEKVITRFLKEPFTLIGSDSIADGSSFPHPRAFGTFPRVFRVYVRERQTLPFGEAVRRMTSLPARHFGIRERGEIRPGFFADLVLLRPEAVSDRADYDEPSRLSEGIVWVFVNGQPVWAGSEATGLLPGRFLRRRGSGETF